MKKPFIPGLLHYFIAFVWIVNGFFCKVLNLVPRHQEIIARIFGNDHSRFLAVFIGLAEMGMAAWILIGIQRRLNVILQIAVIATMNAVEFSLTPDLLLWGKANALFAFLFIVLIYYNEMRYSKKLSQHTVCFLS